MFTTIKKATRTARYIWDVFSEYHIKIALTAGLGFVSGLFGGIGISIIIPLFSLLSPQSATTPDFITRSIQKVFSITKIPLTVPYLLLFIVLIFIAKALVLFWARYYNEIIAAQYEKNARAGLFKKILTSTWPNLLEHKLGFLERVLSYDIQQSAELLSNASTIVLTLTTLIAYGLIVMNISTTMTLGIVVFGILLFGFMKPIFHKTRKFTASTADTFKIVSHHINQVMIGAKIIKANSIEHQMSVMGNRYFEDLNEIRIKNALYYYALGSSFEPIGFVFIAGLFLFNYGAPTFNIASFAVVILLVQRIFSLIQSLQGQAQNTNQLIPYVKIVSDYNREAEQHQEIDIGIKEFSFKERLSFQDVAFGYGNKLVLDNLKLNIPKGSMIGIIGPSGAGKTTIADLLLRLFRPQRGMITLDGIDIQNIALGAWRKEIGYVPQEVFLMNDTIENNIRFYDDSISHEDVVQSAKLANIYETIEGLPNGFETEVGERGLKLSGGQRQRIALARTLARKPQILILDEATSALDNESEALIQKAINGLKKEMTIIIIAHRLSTVMNADRLFLLDDGKIAEEGTPEELINNPDSYFNRMNRS
jgi:ABC-type multidrug transport system fused ATPase/permease subunit